MTHWPQRQTFLSCPGTDTSGREGVRNEQQSGGNSDHEGSSEHDAQSVASDDSATSAAATKPKKRSKANETMAEMVHRVEAFLQVRSNTSFEYLFETEYS